MKISDLKVRTRLFAGFFMLLLIAIVIARVRAAGAEPSQRDGQPAHRPTDWDTITLSNGLRTDVRSLSEYAARFAAR